ncbi:MAG: Rho termination factor N-terminal domain-containing protein, partial [Spirochaetaceae bacterium]|nr:Rho termination factor N-terminal domain-containing protein [Spirochaetaceae bacterium]
MSDSTDLLDAPVRGAKDSTANGDPAASTKPARKRAAGLSGMVLAELQGMASDLGISGTARMRKGQLIEAIKERQGGGSSTAQSAAPAAAKDAEPSAGPKVSEPAPRDADAPGADEPRREGRPRRERQQGDRQQ